MPRPASACPATCSAAAAPAPMTACWPPSSAPTLHGLVADEHYGVTVAMVNRHVTANPLADIAGKTRGVPGDCDMLNVARAMGISLG